jgi:DNA-binding CsgD family transcriptional regulator
MRKLDLKKVMRWTVGITLGLNSIFMVKDISDDIAEGAGIWHIGPEILIVAGTVIVTVLALIYMVKFKERADQSDSKIEVLEQANQTWQKKTRTYSEGLSVEIDQQMVAWGLSFAEKEIVLLLLKGLSNREIAKIRQTSEHTIKQQSSAIYRKSRMGTRAELSAFFLEDLLLPPLQKNATTSPQEQTFNS